LESRGAKSPASRVAGLLGVEMKKLVKLKKWVIWFLVLSALGALIVDLGDGRLGMIVNFEHEGIQFRSQFCPHGVLTNRIGRPHALDIHDTASHVRVKSGVLDFSPEFFNGLDFLQSWTQIVEAVKTETKLLLTDQYIPEVRAGDLARWCYEQSNK
jgi:hypothetical protein